MLVIISTIPQLGYAFVKLPQMLILAIIMIKIHYQHIVNYTDASENILFALIQYSLNAR